MPRQLTKTIALRLSPQLYRAIESERSKQETVSDVVRRLLMSATKHSHPAHPSRSE